MRVFNLAETIDGALARQRRALLILAVWATLAGVALAFVGQYSVSLLFAILAGICAALLYFARQETALTGVIVVVVIFVDFYQIVGLPLREPVVGIALAALLIGALFLTQSDARPWSPVSGRGFWALTLALAGLAVARGSITQTGFYFLTVFVGPLLMYILGAQVARTPTRLKHLAIFMSAVAVFIAVHSIIQGVTGVFLFATLRQEDYLGSVSGFHLAGLSIQRAGSFLENPDWNGAYLAFSFFPLAGLFLMARQTWTRILSGVGACLVLIALLFTFTTASFLSLAIGIALLLWRVVPRRLLRRTLIGLGVAMLAIGVVFRNQVRALALHATANREFTLRLGAWQTAINVIKARPLTGVGLSPSIYIVAAERYRAHWQTRPLAHPHNSYLELAAFAGIPVLLAFLALLVTALRNTARQWRSAPASIKPLVGSIFISLVVLSVNSLAINGWTLAPMAMIAWLLAGAASRRFRLEHQVAGAPDSTSAAREGALAAPAQ
ncbi:MAG TPA: O-antigen ligase family protein [Ktedonobacterales bacterium]